jgi:hypothetical protein
MAVRAGDPACHRLSYYHHIAVSGDFRGYVALPDDLHALIGLLCTADWTNLSLSGTLTERTDFGAWGRLHADSVTRRPWFWKYAGLPDASTGAPDPARQHGPEGTDGRLLLAPGGRFRHEFREHGQDEVRTGDLAWHDRDRPLWPPADELLCPAWLPSRFELTITGTGTAGDRDVIHVSAVPRPFARGRLGVIQTMSAVRRNRFRMLPPGDELVDRLDVVVDAGLGILLRCERRYCELTLTLSELTGVVVDPPEAADSRQFLPPAGRCDHDERAGAEPAGDGEPARTPGSAAARALGKAAASAGVAALTAAIRHAPRPAQSQGQWQAATAGDSWQSFGDPGDPGDPGGPVSGQLLWLIYQAGLYAHQIDAEYRSWRSGDPAMLPGQDSGGQGGSSALSQLAAAASERATDSYQRASIAVGGPDRYRIDYRPDPGPRRPGVVAADGEQRWRVYADRVAIGPAVPLPLQIADLLDPAWLLDWRLTGGQPVRLNDRAGYLVLVHEAGPDRPASQEAGDSEQPGRGASLRALTVRRPAEVVVDAELGVLLRLTITRGEQDQSRFELRQLASGPPRDPAAFRVPIPDDLPAVADTGRILDEADAPAALKAAASVTARAFSGAAGAAVLAARWWRGRSGPPAAG